MMSRVFERQLFPGTFYSIVELVGNAEQFKKDLAKRMRSIERAKRKVPASYRIWCKLAEASRRISIEFAGQKTRELPCENAPTKNDYRAGTKPAPTKPYVKHQKKGLKSSVLFPFSLYPLLFSASLVPEKNVRFCWKVAPLLLVNFVCCFVANNHRKSVERTWKVLPHSQQRPANPQFKPSLTTKGPARNCSIHLIQKIFFRVPGL